MPAVVIGANKETLAAPDTKSDLGSLSVSQSGAEFRKNISQGEDPSVLWEQGSRAFDVHDFGRAIQCYTSALHKTPSYEDKQILRSNITLSIAGFCNDLSEKGEYKLAADMARSQIPETKDPKDRQKLFDAIAYVDQKQGDKDFNSGNFSSAAAHYQAALCGITDADWKKSLSTNIAQSYGRMASESAKNGRYDEALNSAFNGLAAAPPHSQEAHDLKKIIDAAKALPDPAKDAEAYGRKLAVFHSAVGEMLSHQGKFTDAVGAFRTAMESSPEERKYRTALARAWNEAGKDFVQNEDFERAVSCFESGLALHTSHDKELARNIHSADSSVTASTANYLQKFNLDSPKVEKAEIEKCTQSPGLGDCWLVSGVLELGVNKPGKELLRESVRPVKSLSGAGTDYEVTLNGVLDSEGNIQTATHTYHITADDIRTSIQKPHVNGDIEPLLIEIAARKQRELYQLPKDGGDALDAGQDGEGIGLVTGKSVEWLHTQDEITTALHLIAQNRDGYAATCSFGDRSDDKLGIIPNHTYGIRSVKLSPDGSGTVDLINPWDVSQHHELPLSEVASICNGFAFYRY